MKFTWIMRCHCQWSKDYRPLVSIPLSLMLPAPSTTSSIMWNLLSIFLSVDFWVFDGHLLLWPHSISCSDCLVMVPSHLSMLNLLKHKVFKNWNTKCKLLCVPVSAKIMTKCDKFLHCIYRYVTVMDSHVTVHKNKINAQYCISFT